MKHRSLSLSSISVISLILVYVLTVGLFLIFFNELMQTISTSETFNNRIILAIGLLLVMLFLFIIILYALKFIHNSRAGHAGSRFRIRLVSYFILLSVLSTVPQGLLSLNFLNSALKTWFNDDVYQALNGGLNIALDHYHGEIMGLRRLSDSSMVNNFVKDFLAGHEDSIGMMSSLDAVDIFDGDSGALLFSAGSEAAVLDFGALEMYEPGSLPKRTVDGLSILSEYRIIKMDKKDYHVVLSVFLTKEFDHDTRLLADSLESFRQLNQFRSFFQLGIVLVFLFFSLPLMLLAVLVSFFLSSEISRPITNLEVAIRKVAEGDYSYRLVNKEEDDLLSLYESFNQMIRELENTRESTRQTQKISAWQEIAQRLAHELRNPLTPIQLSAQRVLRNQKKLKNVRDERIVDSMETIIQEVTRLDVLLREFRDFARMPVIKPLMIPLKETVQGCADSYKSSYPDIYFDFRTIDDETMIFADPVQIVQVFSNLFKNAAEAMLGSGTIMMNAFLIKKGYQDFFRITITDDGLGIKEEDKEKVFHPYFTTKQMGTGLGLPIIERIIFDHKGKIWLESEYGKGTTFYIDLPLEKKE